MKQLFTLLFVLIVSAFSIQTKANVITDAVDSVSTTVKKSIEVIDTSSNFQSMYQDLRGGIVALAKSMKIGAEHVYGILVRQQLVEAIIFLILGIIATLFIRALIKTVINKEFVEEGYSENLTGIGIIRLVQGIIGVFLLFAFFINMDTVITGFINPEYGAIKEIIEMVNANRK